MTEVKRKKGQKRSDEKPCETQQLVVSLNVSNGEIIKLEVLEESGQRREVTEDEFAKLSGEDEHADIEAALEEAYAAGISDAVDESIQSEFDEDEDEEIGRTLLREAAARQLLRRGVRRLIVRRYLERGVARKEEKSEHNGASEAAKH